MIWWDGQLKLSHNIITGGYTHKCCNCPVTCTCIDEPLHTSFKHSFWLSSKMKKTITNYKIYVICKWKLNGFLESSFNWISRIHVIYAARMYSSGGKLIKWACAK